MKYSYIWRAVERIIKRHGTTDPIQLSNSCRYHIIFKEMSVWGRFVRFNRREGAIGLKCSLRRPTKLFVASHELGHGVLGHDSATDFTENNLSARWFYMTREEKEANLFAVHLRSFGYDWSQSGGDLKLASSELGVPYQILEQYILTRGFDSLLKRYKPSKTTKNRRFIN